jgi:hypothetical protein
MTVFEAIVAAVGLINAASGGRGCLQPEPSWSSWRSWVDCS